MARIMSLIVSFRNMQLPDRQCRDRQDMKDIKIGDPVRFGRNTGEYRGQFDKLNIAMVLVGNRLYYVTFEKIEKL